MRRELFYVDISHLRDADLEFFGYSLVAEDDEFKLFSCYDGEEHIVAKDRPHLLVIDVNEANEMRAFRGFIFNRVDD